MTILPTTLPQQNKHIQIYSMCLVFTKKHRPNPSFWKTEKNH